MRGKGMRQIRGGRLVRRGECVGGGRGGEMSMAA